MSLESRLNHSQVFLNPPFSSIFGSHPVPLLRVPQIHEPSSVLRLPYSMFSCLKGYPDMALGSQVIYLIRPNLLNNTYKSGGIREVTLMKYKPSLLLMRILVQMIYSIRIKQGSTPLDTMYGITLFQQKLGQICPILSRDTCNECLLQFNLQDYFFSSSCLALNLAGIKSPARSKRLLQ